MRSKDRFDDLADTLVHYDNEFRLALTLNDDARLADVIAAWAREHWGADRPEQEPHDATFVLDSGGNDTCLCGRRYDEPNHNH